MIEKAEKDKRIICYIEIEFHDDVCGHHPGDVVCFELSAIPSRTTNQSLAQALIEVAEYFSKF